MTASTATARRPSSAGQCPFSGVPAGARGSLTAAEYLVENVRTTEWLTFSASALRHRPRRGRPATGTRTGRTVGVCWDTGNVVGVGRNTLVGREAELSHLVAVLESAAAGRPIVTLISGDAGVGKTRLVA